MSVRCHLSASVDWSVAAGSALLLFFFLFVLFLIWSCWGNWRQPCWNACYSLVVHSQQERACLRPHLSVCLQMCALVAKQQDPGCQSVAVVAMLLCLSSAAVSSEEIWRERGSRYLWQSQSLSKFVVCHLSLLLALLRKQISYSIAPESATLQHFCCLCFLKFSLLVFTFLRLLSFTGSWTLSKPLRHTD